MLIITGIAHMPDKSELKVLSPVVESYITQQVNALEDGTQTQYDGLTVKNCLNVIEIYQKLQRIAG